MNRVLLSLAIVFAQPAAAGAAGDPLESPECRSALEALQRREATLASAPAKAAAATSETAAAASEATAAASAPVTAPRTGPLPAEPHRTRVADAQLDRLRRDAARACLASRTDAPAPTPGRLAQPPVAAPPVAAPPQARSPGAQPLADRPPTHAPPRATNAAAGLPPVPRPTAPTVVTTCDATGCWTSDGKRLDRAGPNLLGPRGLCQLQGVLVQCP